mmetsp:Transcript_33855/g.54095  ORF Transcript_33855/g.54095 Transcript_33855/m.54095 type:complete len:207 (-) Transcript_33855:1249-1869(-)
MLIEKALLRRGIMQRKLPVNSKARVHALPAFATYFESSMHNRSMTPWCNSLRQCREELRCCRDSFAYCLAESLNKFKHRQLSSAAVASLAAISQTESSSTSGKSMAALQGGREDTSAASKNSKTRIASNRCELRPRQTSFRAMRANGSACGMNEDRSSQLGLLRNIMRVYNNAGVVDKVVVSISDEIESESISITLPFKSLCRTSS